MNNLCLLLLISLLIVWLIYRSNKDTFVENEKLCLAVISTKNPTELLLETVNGIKKFYPEFDIVIVDSDSTDFSGYKKIPKDIKIDYVKNTNYEYGAYYYAYHKYPYYDIYMLTQDSNTPIERIPNFDELIKDEDILFHREVFHDVIVWPRIKQVYENTHVSFILDEIMRQTKEDMKNKVHLANDNFLIGHNDIIGKVVELEVPYQQKNLTKNKEDSIVTEFMGGVMGDHYKKKWIDVKPYYRKVHSWRT